MKQLFLRLDAFLDSGMDEKDDKDRLKHRFLVYVLLTPFDLDFVAVYLLLNIWRFGGVFGLGDFQKKQKKNDIGINPIVYDAALVLS